MKFVLKSETYIRPIAFLCGPYYTGQDNDRRKILLDYLASKPIVALPIIVDKFLDKSNINDNTIKVPLLEEICATASYKIYIFLDTFSSVAELGMFSHASTNNSLVVFLPEKRDKLTEQINTFVNEVLLSDKIEVLYYRPRITRVPVASDYVIEYYEFPYNKVPENIKGAIDSDTKYTSNDLSIRFKESDKISNNYEEICYSLTPGQIAFHINLKMMFYIIASIVVTTNEYNPERLIVLAKEILLLSMKSSLSANQAQINTSSLVENIVIVSHIIKFLELFEKFGQVTGEKIITKEQSFIRPTTILDFFHIEDNELRLIRNYIDSNAEFIETFSIKKGSKTRKLTKYRDDPNGIALRKLHAKYVCILEQSYKFSDFSFAYRKNFGIYDCVRRHICSNYFVKIDISNFFNSITYSKLYSSLKQFFKEDIVYDQNYVLLIKSLLFNNILPLGFVSSPIISDMFLSTFDIHIAEILHQKYPRVIYTRYADDMFFSSATEIDESVLTSIISIVSDELASIHLSINTKKTEFSTLANTGDHVKLLGLNIVKGNEQNIITVGKKYIYDTASLLLNYIKNNVKLSEQDKYYQQKIIIGRVAYIKQIEGQSGYQLLQKRVLKSTRGRIQIPNDRLSFDNDWLTTSV